MDGRRTGLSYPGVEACIRLCGFGKRERHEAFAAIQAMEWAALDEWAREINRRSVAGS